MGTSRWNTDDYKAYASSTNYRSATRAETFKNSNLPKALDPSQITVRESRDSEQNPMSTPIILALDVTGSMGKYAEIIAKDALPVLMQGIYEQTPVTDPHVMFMGVGDVKSDRAPLQVSQFEAGAEVLVSSLRELWLEGHGGGNNTESYDLPWYFAATSTSCDSFEKRGTRGFLFTFGDELPPPMSLSLNEINKVFGNKDMPIFESTEELLEAVQKKFQVFHVIIEQGGFCERGARLQEVRAKWTKLLGANVLFLRKHESLAELVLSTMRIASGADMESVISESSISDELRYAYNLNG